MDSKKARATAITIILFLVLASSIFYLKNKAINWKVGILCAIGGTVGGFIGSKILVKINSKFLEIIFIIFLIYSGIRMIL